MSSNIAESSTGYFGIINGIMYRIDAITGSSERMSGLAPLEIPRAPVANHSLSGTSRYPLAENPVPPPPTAASSVAPRACRLACLQPIAEETRREREERAAALFDRDGAEPLRAGHPDLWNLLVTGTCLEGSTFHSVR